MSALGSIRIKPLTWHPHLPPVEIEDATPEQLEAMKVTPSAKKVSPYVRTLAHDPESYVARTTLFNAIMYAEGGLPRADRELGALAASQVNVHERVVVIDLSEDHSEPRVFINPELEPLTEDLEEMQEGCLSVPGFYESINRPERVRVKALDRDGNPFDEVYEGLLAVCIQHECDHLNGKLFVDYLSNLKRDRIRKKLEKIHRTQATS